MSENVVPRGKGFWRSFRSDRVRAVLSLGIVLGFGSVGTLAAWTDEATASGATFSSGTINLRLDADADDDFDFSAMGVTNIVPGSTEAQTIQVNNIGTAPFKYTVTSAATNGDTKALRDALVWKLTLGTASGLDLSRVCSGTTLYSGTGINGTLVTPGRSLVALTGTETLCFQVTLPTAALSALQGATTTATLTFTATSDMT